MLLLMLTLFYLFYFILFLFYFIFIFILFYFIFILFYFYFYFYLTTRLARLANLPGFLDGTMTTVTTTPGFASAKSDWSDWIICIWWWTIQLIL